MTGPIRTMKGLLGSCPDGFCPYHAAMAIMNASEALAVTGPLVHDGYLVEVNEGVFSANEANASDRGKYSDSGSVPVPAGV